MELIMPFVFGLALVGALLRGREKEFFFPEKLALSLVGGWGAQAIVMFFLSLLGIRLTAVSVITTELALVIILLPFAYKFLAASRSGEKSRFSWWEFLLLGLLALKVFFVFWSACLKPIIDPDLLGCYTFAAKMIFINGQIPLAPLLDKPLLPSQVWGALTLGVWDDSRLLLYSPVLFACGLTIAYSALARHYKRSYALLGAFLLGTIPFFAFHAGTAYADFLQAFYYFAATVYLYLFIKDRGEGNLLLGALFLGLTVWAKRSGIYYAGIDLFVLGIFLFVSRREINWRTAALALALLAAITLPWFAYQPFVTMKYYAAQAAGSVVVLPAERAATAGGLGASFLRNTFYEDNWHLLGLALLATVILYRREAWARPRRYLLGIIVLQFAAMFTLLTLTDWALWAADETALNRLTLHFVPVITYFCLEVFGAGERTWQRSGPTLSAE
jgi:hypothetical protein